MLPYPPIQKNRARRLRREQTDVENKLWARLRSRQLCGAKFRRQHPIGPFITDFCCVERQLVIELDGSQHANQGQADRDRSSLLHQHGYRVLRFWDNEVLENIDAVLERIVRALNGPHPTLSQRARETIPERWGAMNSTGSCAVLLLIVVFYSAFGAHAGQRDLQKLTVGYTPISGAALPFFVAVEERLFQKYGFDVSPVFMGGSPLINSAILAGEFPIGYTGGGAVISSRLSGSDLIVIASPLPVLTIDGWAKPDIKSVSDLRGKRIGVTRFGASTYFAALSMLESAGLKASDVVFIQNGGVGESLAALLAGRVDACMIGYPFGLRAKKEGFHLLFRPLDTEYGLFPTAVIAARESWIGRNRKFAIDFLRGLNEGQLLTRENAAVSKRALRKYTRVDDDAALQGTVEFFKDAFPSTLRTADRAIANALKFVDHPKAKQSDPKQFYDNSLIDEAVK